MPVPILMYHSVAAEWPDSFGRWTVTPAVFASHLDAIAASGYTAITVSGAVDMVRSGRSLPPKTVILTFDDGFADFYVNALPLLEARGFPATLYVTTGYLDSTSRWLDASGAGTIPMMSLDQLGGLADRGVEVGAHSRSHAMLDLLHQTQLEAEIHAPRNLLREASGSRRDQLRVSAWVLEQGSTAVGDRRWIRFGCVSPSLVEQWLVGAVRDPPPDHRRGSRRRTGHRGDERSRPAIEVGSPCPGRCLAAPAKGVDDDTADAGSQPGQWCMMDAPSPLPQAVNELIGSLDV